MNQTLENGKKPNFRPDFGLFGPNLGPQLFFFFCKFYLYQYLDILLSYHPIQFKGKLMNQTWENGKKPHFGPDFGLFWSKFGTQKFFVGLPLLGVIHCCKLSLHAISRKTNELNLRKCKKSSFGPDFGSFDPNLVPKNSFLWILPLLDVRNCCKLSLYAISRKINEPNLRKW